MNIIGISGLHNSVIFKKNEFPNLLPAHYRISQGFDAAAALVSSDGIKAAAGEERFVKEKGTCSFPVNAIKYCLESNRLIPENIDYIAHGFLYEPYHSFYEQDEFTYKQYTEVYSRKALVSCINRYFPDCDWCNRLVQVPHHYAHAASTFYLSGYKEALILIADGMGEVYSTTVAIGRDNEIEIIKQVPALHSLGIFYGVFTMYLGFEINMDEGKIMGLAPYGNPRRYYHKLMEFIQLSNDGTYTTPLIFQNKTIEDKETYRGTLQVLTDAFGPQREHGAEINQKHMDIAAALQAALQTVLLHILRHFRKETGQRNLCMAGGVALNCTANSVIKRSRLFKNIFVQPAAADDGTALGAGLYVQHQYKSNLHLKKMDLPLWGPEYSDETIQLTIDKYEECKSTLFSRFEDLTDAVAMRLAEGQIVSWFQGRMEFGPRALGSRSILADPRRSDMRDRINRLIKKREDFRPFAPAVTAEAASNFFEIDSGEETLYAYMLFVTQVQTAYRGQLPAITHVDGSARVQVVSQKDNRRFWALLDQFGKVSGIPILLNTSFNVRGQPIVCTPNDAIETFLSAKLDALAIGNHIVVHRNL